MWAVPGRGVHLPPKATVQFLPKFDFVGRGNHCMWVWNDSQLMVGSWGFYPKCFEKLKPFNQKTNVIIFVNSKRFSSMPNQ